MRIAREGLIETFLLSIVGGLLGLGVAFAATRALIAFVSRGNTYIAMSPTPDRAVLLFHAWYFSFDRNPVRAGAVSQCGVHRVVRNAQRRGTHPSEQWRETCAILAQKRS